MDFPMVSSVLELIWPFGFAIRGFRFFQERNSYEELGVLPVLDQIKNNFCFSGVIQFLDIFSTHFWSC